MASVPELKKDFTRLLKKGNLFHGYIFFGESAEKLDFANGLANFLENNRWGKSSAPLLDFRIIGNGIDDVRAGINFLWQKPVRSPRKTLIIPDARNLTPEAQNAILKVAEEPPAHALIILLINNLETLLPTVVSRFQKIYFTDAKNTKENANDANKIAKEFLKASPARRKEIIKEVIEDDGKLEDFVTGLISELRRDTMNNWRTIKELLKRWTLIRRYNTNKRLQLEAALNQLRILTELS
ncbi:MAG: hypothetical protein A2745_00620 [Candidatus Harrisonbacteria bacterium RIFCSPHIGHO2_01_FULL_44_13]|uniref:DNA polymerase III subunit delta n=1 Tax=Candidatus Harrisonbacteria bacterium RIFCSPLOWO2_01_FULL_44_18 TaxID=1798407 RepID=A0A1G1ZMG7_9BACT|nr:MAG: hypothetical protein A2745_00620 [Candidatus Harrisonbacteria bacterium RIFCSPHIGHO2_01_FULL_44_13]OGY65858.1 MAG: hypothetical protein A3A16_02220 [Candidatus Harrisonbacteria bacterium RIFCSPLOWO2_01_FULL_44_18]